MNKTNINVVVLGICLGKSCLGMEIKYHTSGFLSDNIPMSLLDMKLAWVAIQTKCKSCLFGISIIHQNGNKRPPLLN